MFCQTRTIVQLVFGQPEDQLQSGGIMKFHKVMLRLASGLCVGNLFLACGISQQESPGSDSMSAKTTQKEKEISQKVKKDKFGKAYENLEFDFNDFLEDELGIWGSGDESRYQRYKAGYESLYQSIRIKSNRLNEVDDYVDTILRHKARYQKIESSTGVPWFWVGITHGLEGSFDFDTHLHNGDSLQRRTWQEPSGRPAKGSPPFTWEFSASDAILMKGYDSWKNWEIASVLAYSFEKYNGFGYRSSRANGVNSPYLWSFSNHFTKGKYVADGVFDPDATSEQAGAMVILKRGLDRGVFKLVEQNPTIVQVKSTAKPLLLNVLYQGVEDSDDVLLLKMRLRSFGYNPGTLNRTFDTVLTEAVTKFQTDVGVDADGAVGTNTWTLLWPSISNATWLKGWSYAEGIDLRAMSGGRCLFKIATNDSPALAGFMKSAISARTVTFGGDSSQSNMPANCPDTREVYNLTKVTTSVNLAPVPRFPGAGTAATVQLVSRGTNDEWNISAANGSQEVGKVSTRVKDELVNHLSLHAKANKVLPKPIP
jgi:lysozyme family protein